MVAFEVYLHILSNRLDQIESGYQKLADPEITRVVITRF